MKAYLVDVSSVVEFQRRWVLKSMIFGQTSTYSRTTNVFCEFMNDSLSKSAKIVLSKLIFYVKNTTIQSCCTLGS